MPREPTLRQAGWVHMVGIGGSGMAALSSLLLQMGKRVSGSDTSLSAATRGLVSAGATVSGSHAASNLSDGVEYVVRSSAIDVDNPELREAVRRGLPTRKLAEAVAELMAGRSVVAVAGTHGKTTTTALLAWLLQQAGCDPLALIGADTPAFRLGATPGDGPCVIEADEYDRRFLSYWPEVAIVTSIEADHLDYYRDLAEIRSAFAQLVGRLPEHGRLVVCADEPCAASLASPARRERYGFAPQAEWRVAEYTPIAGHGSRLTLVVDGRDWALESPLVGQHNACNVAAAIAAADHFGVGMQLAAAALRSFRGPRRRFETRGRPRGIWLVDDYAHHPTEVAAVLRTARSVAEGDVWVVFQPHTTHRTLALLGQFAGAFDDAQHALVLPIYRPRGRERSERPVSSAALVEAINQRGHPDARVVDSFQAAEHALLAGAKPGDLVLTMGAGDVTLLADRLLEALAGC